MDQGASQAVGVGCPGCEGTASGRSLIHSPAPTTQKNDCLSLDLFFFNSLCGYWCLQRGSALMWSAEKSWVQPAAKTKVMSLTFGGDLGMHKWLLFSSFLWVLQPQQAFFSLFPHFLFNIFDTLPSCIASFFFCHPQSFVFPRAFFPPTSQFCGVGREEMTFCFINKWAGVLPCHGKSVRNCASAFSPKLLPALLSK